MDKVIATAIAKDPAHRYSSAGDLATAARAALDPPAAGRAAPPGRPSPSDVLDPPTVPGLRLHPPQAPTVPPDPVPSNRAERRRRLALTGVLVLLAAGLGVLWFNQGRSGPGGVGAPGGTTTVVALPSPTPAVSTPRPTELGLVGHADTVCAVATAQLGGRPVAVTGSWDKTLRVWDLATGASTGAPMTGHTDLVLAVATAKLNGRPVAISAGKDKTVRVWDLATGSPIRTPLTGHTDAVFAVATAQLNGRSVAISAGADETIRVWDLATGSPIGSPLTGHTSHVFAVTTAQLGGRPVVISASADKTIRVWDLATGAPIGKPLTGHTGRPRPRRWPWNSPGAAAWRRWWSSSTAASSPVH